jgi:hypothetical protein
VSPSAPRPHGRGVFASDVAVIHLEWEFAISAGASLAPPVVGIGAPAGYLAALARDTGEKNS